MGVSEGQVNAALRHVSSYGGGIVTAMAVLGFMDAENSKALITALNETVEGLSQATAGISKIMIIVGPIMGVLGATYASRAAGVPGLVAALFSAAKKDNDVKKEVLNAAADVPGVKKIVTDMVTANSVPSEKVVSQ